MSRAKKASPRNWSLQTVSDVVKVNPRTPVPTDWKDSHPVPHFGMAAIDEFNGTLRDADLIPLEQCRSDKTRFRNDDVLFAKITPCVQNQKSALVTGLDSEIGFGSSEFYVLRATERILPEYLFFFLRQKEIVEKAVESFTGSSGRQRVPSSFWANLRVPVPALPVQEQIVSILRKSGDICRKRQEAIKIADKVLDAAFSSMFGNPSSNPTLNVLSKGISSIRNGLPRRRKTIANEGTIVLRIQDVGDGQIDFDNINRIQLDENEEESFLLKEGDLLLVRVNGNKDLVGRNALFDGYHEPVAHNDHLMRVRFNENLLLPEYVSAFLHTSFGHHELSLKVATSAGNHSINQNGVGSMRIPYPSIRAQEKFVSTVNYFQRARTRLVSGFDESNNIFSSLLSRAFTGELTAEWEAANVELIAQQQRLYEHLPQLLLLAFLHERQTKSKAAKASLLVTALMKYVFLFQMEATARRRLYHFIPYHYGPFAKELYSDLEALSALGFITIDNGDDVRTRITLTDSGELEALFTDLPDDVKEDVESIIETYGDLDHSELLHRVYEKYPAYAQKSRLKRPQK